MSDSPVSIIYDSSGNEKAVSGNPLRVDPTGTTAQPVTDNGGSLTVDGTVTANIGTTNGLALDATLTGGTVRSKITDGTNNAAVKAGSFAALTTDPALVVAISPNNTVGITSSAIANIAAGAPSAGIQIAGPNAVGVMRAPNVMDSNPSGTEYGLVVRLAGGNSGGTSSTLGSAVPVMGTTAGFSDGTNLQAARVYDTNTGAPAEYVQGVVLRSSGGSGSVELGTSSNPIRVSPVGSVSQPVTLADGASLDAFNRLRVSSGEAVFSSKLLNNARTNHWDAATISGTPAGVVTWGASGQNDPAALITVTGVGTYARQSKKRITYHPGKSNLVLITATLVPDITNYPNSPAEGVDGAITSGVTRRVGIFDGTSGWFFELAGTTLKVVKRSNGSATDVPWVQSSWNIDKMDGTGISGKTVNVNNSNIFVIDYQWLGVGRIRFGLCIDGIIYYCHQILWANTQPSVTIYNPNLPIRYEIANSSATGQEKGLLQICSTVITEGGDSGAEDRFGCDTGTSSLVTTNSTNTYTLLAIRMKSGYLNAEVVPTQYSVVSSTGSSQWKTKVIMNPTIAGSLSWTSADADSAVEYAVGAQANTITGGTVIFTEFAQSNKAGGLESDLQHELQLGSTIAGVSDILVLAVQPIPGNALTMYGTLNWKEVI